MSLHRRLVLLSAGVVGIAVVLAVCVSYVVVRAELRGQVDEVLRDQERRVERIAIPGGPPPMHLPLRRDSDDAPIFIQRLDSEGQRAPFAPMTERLPVTAGDRSIARSGQGRSLEDRVVEGKHLRVLTVPTGDFGAIQFGRSLEEIDSVLARLRVVLLLVAVGGVLLVAVTTRAFTRAMLAPITRLSETAEHVSNTEDLSRRIDVRGSDEVARLARRFNAMLDTLESSQGALASSVKAQRQLVADASHELRTPVTSVRTNLELLLDPKLPERERRGMIPEVLSQTEHLSALITDIIQLARGDQRAETEDVRLDQLVSEVVSEVERFWPGVRFERDLRRTSAPAMPDRLARAVRNLLENAARHSPPGAAVEVTVREGQIAVRDHGPGVPEAEAKRIFDRFYRGNGSGGAGGFGLGLAIVRQVAEAHGGRVSVERPDGGGAVFRFTVPTDGYAQRTPS